MKNGTIIACALLALAQLAVAEERIEISLLRQPTLAESPVGPGLSQADAAEDNRDQKTKTARDGKYELLQKKLREVDQLQRDIDQLRSELGTQQQIQVRVEMLEVSLTKLRTMGIDWTTAETRGGRLNIDDVASLQKAIVSDKLNLSQNLPTQSESATVKSLLECMTKNHIAKVLANPTLTTLSGRPACVFVGKELPAPDNGAPESAVEYHKCGTELDVLAEALPNANVRLHVRTRVSKPNDARSIKVGDTTIPAIEVRACDTTVETTFGKPVVLNGLVDRRSESIRNDSGDGEIVETINEVALMVVVTPELIDSPVTAEDQSGDKLRK
jgi:Flp pilus assembly secretin CpaC